MVVEESTVIGFFQERGGEGGIRGDRKDFVVGCGGMASGHYASGGISRWRIELG